MARTLISSGSSFETDIGYSRAVVDDDWIFVSGTTGFDYRHMSISDDPVEQTRQCLKNIEAALIEAGAVMADIVRVTRANPVADPKTTRLAPRHVPTFMMPTLHPASLRLCRLNRHSW